MINIKTLCLIWILAPFALFASQKYEVIKGESLRPAQVRVSRFLAQLKDVTLEGDLYKGDDNLATVKVMDSPPYYLLTDGHHHALSAVMKGAKNFRVACLETFSKEEITKRIKEDENGFSYSMTVHLWTMSGVPRGLIGSMEAFGREAEDDSLRGFLGVSNLQFKYSKTGELKMVDSPGEGIMFWKKVKGFPHLSKSGLLKAPSFAEFILASLLRTMGFSEKADPLNVRDVSRAQSFIEEGRRLLGKDHRLSKKFPFNWLKPGDLEWVYFLPGHQLKRSKRRRIR